MRIYSKVLSPADIYGELRLAIETNDVVIESYREFTPRAGGRGYEVYLEGLGARHKRARNGRGGKAASWDDYGLWMARLFKLDPAAKISHYNGVGEFIAFTRQYQPRDASAPWLADDALLALDRLEYLRGELRAERISYGELAELQDLSEHIPADDLELREAAGLPEDTLHYTRGIGSGATHHRVAS